MSAFLDDRPRPVRSLSRFLTFALVVIVAVTGLTARLFYLQIVDGGRLATLATRNRIVLEPIQSPRGLIYDRNGRPLVTNVPTFVVKLRPSDLPLDQRPVVVDRLAALLGMSAAEINATIDGNPGSTFDLVRIATDVDESTARLIAEAGFDMPGVEVAVEARRQYADGPLMSQILGYTGPVSGEQLPRPGRSAGYLPDDLIGKVGIEAQYETAVARRLRAGERRARRVRPQDPGAPDDRSEAQPGDSLTLTIDTKEQQNAQKALMWAMKTVGHQAWCRHRHEPADGRDPRPGQPADVRQQPVRPRHQQRGLRQAARRTRTSRSSITRRRPTTHRARPTSSSPGPGVLADKKITPTTKVQTRGYLTLGSTRFYDWNHRGFGACNIYCGFGHSSDTFFFQMAGKLGIDRLGYWAKQYGFGPPTGIDLPGEVSGIVPTNQWKQDVFGPRSSPRDLPGGDRPGLRRRHPDPVDQRLRGAGQRRDAPPAAARRDIVGPDGTVVRPFKPKILHK